MEPSERALLESTVHDALAAADGAGGTAPDDALAGVGWLEMLAAEPAVAVDVVFTALGRTNASASALDDVIVAGLGLSPRPDLAVVLPPFATWRAPGRIDADRCRAFGLGTARSYAADKVLVVCDAGSDACAVSVPRASADVQPAGGVDPEGGWHVVRAERGVAVETRFDREGWETAVAWGQRAVAHQIAGACRSELALARTHALERVQFGRPVATFQAVRHRLADALVAVEALDATLAAATDEPNALTAALAKATAGRTARTVATSCQQVLAGVGFTTDHPFHRFLKRTMALEGLFGSADSITLDLGQRLLTTRRVPTLIEL
jgi:hypothetical protein